MPEGLKLIVGADTQEAVKALDNLEKKAKQTGTAASQAFGQSTIKAGAALNKLSTSSNAATLSLTNLGRVVQDAPFGFIGIANNLNPLVESFQRLKASTGSTGGALKALGKELTGAGGLGIAISVVSTALILFGDQLFGVGKKAKEAADAGKALQDSIKGVFGEVAKEATQVGSLVTVLQSETETRNRKLSAIKELQQIQPEIFRNLKLEGDAVIGLDASYNTYLSSLRKVIGAKIIQAQLEAQITRLLTLQGVGITGITKGMKDLEDSVANLRLPNAGKGTIFENVIGTKQRRDAEAERVQKEIDRLFAELKLFSDGIKVPDLKIKPDKITIDKTEFPPLRVPFTLGEFNFDQNRFRDALLGKLTPALSFVEQVLGQKINIGDALADQLANEKLLAAGNAAVETMKRVQAQQKELANSFGLGGTSVLTDLQKQAVFAAKTIDGVLTPAFQNLFSAIVAGENPMKAFFEGLGQAVQQLISKLIAAAVQALVLSAIFPGGIGGAKGFGSIFGKLIGLAQGGIVSGPTLALVGEGVGTSRSNPEVVAPLDQLRSMLEGMGGGSQVVVVNGRLRGRDMILQNSRTSRSQRRTNGR